MKTIIAGKRYDTDKADYIGERESPYHVWASLYVTKRSKAYFLAGRGGDLFGRETGPNTWTHGEGIIPLTREQAFEWAEEHLKPEIVERHFGDMIEDA